MMDRFSRSQMNIGCLTVLLAATLYFCQASPSLAASPEETDFFERKIRPVLVEKCYLCHSAQSPTPMGGLRLDSPEALLKGGHSGPALVAGQPEKSLLIKAISYKDLNLKMPPTGKLADEQIADFITWVRMGVPDSRTATSPAGPTYEKKEIDFAEGRKFWVFRPVQDSALPPVRQKNWPTSPIDYFLLEKLEANGLKPAPAADKRTWLRRVTFDLTGLPPAPSEIESFLNDRSPDAKMKVVDRLLASPHYGERWGRHWLDLVRFAETNGHEFDNDKPDAWRYRDYVIRAFNADLPYNQFVKEHIAGDLISTKRLSFDGSYWESPIGTSFYWFGEVLNSATDSVKSRADEVDNQIDVMGKAFQGLTVACARCHDHKFDPIPTADYYALAGLMHSTSVSETIIDSPSHAQRIASLHQQIIEVDGQIKSLLRTAQLKLASQLKTDLVAAAVAAASQNSEKKDRSSPLTALQPEGLRFWTEAFADARKRPEDVFYSLVTVADCLVDQKSVSVPKLIDRRYQELKELAAQASLTASGRKIRGEMVYEDFEKLDYFGWQVSGEAFGMAPQREIPSNQVLRGFQGQGLASSFGGGSERWVGSLTSAKFKMPKLFLHVRMAGSKEAESGDRAKLRLTLVADGHKSQNLVPDGSEKLQWKTIRLTKEIGRLCYFEIVDRSREGHLVVDDIVLSDEEKPPHSLTAPNPSILRMLGQRDLQSFDALVRAYQDLFTTASRPVASPHEAEQSLWLALNPTGRLEDLASLLEPQAQKEMSELQRRRASLESEIPESVFALVARDENPTDVRLHIRGNHKNLGEPVPRRFLQIVAGQDQMSIVQGSGRLQVAEWIAREDNPLTARVMVNRLWKHHFGEGLVRSADNFGKTGDKPTHPELLDFLARRFVEGGWSVKALHRLMLLSSAYAMSSQPSETAAKVDPQNFWLHHMPVRRLEAETIRDTILAVAGNLDRRLHGPSVPPHVSEYQDGRGKPKSGPLDGDRRRSIYLQVRRNFLTPLFLAFDYPLPISAMGRRSVSTVPSQALIMMNNEFVALEAREWARRVLSVQAAPQELIRRMYLEAFGRPPEPWETTEVLEFVHTRQKHYPTATGQDAVGNAELESWSDLGHVLLNSAELIYVR